MPAVKLDENVPDSVGTILLEAGHDVAFARDEHLAGVPDHQVLTAATDEGRVLVSFDRGFTNVIRCFGRRSAAHRNAWRPPEAAGH